MIEVCRYDAALSRTWRKTQPGRAGICELSTMNGHKTREKARSWRWRVVRHALSALLLTSILASCLQSIEASGDTSTEKTASEAWPAGDPRSGKDLFVDKGCVVCHSVNGVGGRAALPLDAPPDGREIDPMVFAAAMWEGASAMLSLQFTELGYQIGMTGQELRDLAAFASNLESTARLLARRYPRASATTRPRTLRGRLSSCGKGNSSDAIVNNPSKTF